MAHVWLPNVIQGINIISIYIMLLGVKRTIDDTLVLQAIYMTTAPRYTVVND
jgi:hypothetical protein